MTPGTAAYPSSVGFPVEFPHSLVCFKSLFLAVPDWKMDDTKADLAAPLSYHKRYF